MIGEGRNEVGGEVVEEIVGLLEEVADGGIGVFNGHEIHGVFDGQEVRVSRQVVVGCGG